MDPITYRTASIMHLPQILEIERGAFPSPWDVSTFTSTMDDHRCEGIVAIDDGMVVGYCFAIHLTNMVHVLNLAVHPLLKRKGIARRLVRDVLAGAVSKNKMYAVLEVRKANVPALTLYSSMGFTHVSTWHRYYSDTNEDAHVMVKDLRTNVAKDVECIIVKNQELASDTFFLVLEGDLPPSDPGQFAMVMVSRTNEPFLRRPLAILAQKGGIVEMLYRIRGAGTQLLSRKRSGETIRVLGPLGKGFKKPEAESIIYVAGGTGLPPILSLAERVKTGVFIYGAKTANEIPFPERISAIPNTETVLVTEDGSLGEHGLATGALRRITGCTTGNTTIYACGPVGMLKEAKMVASAIGARCEISLEERMSCGFGACSGCVIKTNHGNVRVCREGPVFNAFDIIWS
jgi:dihydroorotate dehydrogenase electron transfer subunit